MKRKIINDPVFGFINIPNDFLYEIIQHPYFQRMNRIKQLGLSSFVYPGAQHTRMLHSLGAMHLMGEAIAQLRLAGQMINFDEENAARACMLLHDIGHGPFSHTLEHTIVQGISHEQISLWMMERMNEEMGGRLDLAIKIFTNKYKKHFLHQLVSSQLDMDRLDYLSRDSFFCGVSEGIVGSQRIIKMLNLHDDRLVVEEKGIYSVEKFLVARRLMYWQVYLHKTSVASETMLTKILKRAKELAAKGEELFASPSLRFFLYTKLSKYDFGKSSNALEQFSQLDDTDILSAVKVWAEHPDTVLSMLCTNFTNRKLFKVKMVQKKEHGDELQARFLESYCQKWGIDEHEASFFIQKIIVSTDTYSSKDDTINILYKDGTVKDIAEASDMLNIEVLTKKVEKHYLCYLNI
ncbi:MAG: HD domain-containing protein [Paludibacteraceae bacterium]